jgi:protein-tyrosine phosphatase
LETPLVRYHFLNRIVYTCSAPCLIDDEPTDVPDLLENIQGFVWGLHEKGIQKAVVLLTEEEMEYFYQGELITLYEMFGIEILHYPIVDGGIPNSMESFAELQKQLVEITKTHPILIHCFAGRDRTGMVLAGLILTLGGHIQRALQLIRSKNREALQNKEQRRFLEEYHRYLVENKEWEQV